MTDETYNGWKNYPTWAVNLWLTNDQGTYKTALDIAGDERTRSEHRRYDVSHTIKEWIREECESDDASLGSDLLGYALDCVDWYEIADAFIADVADGVNA